MHAADPKKFSSPPLPAPTLASQLAPGPSMRLPDAPDLESRFIRYDALCSQQANCAHEGPNSSHAALWARDSLGHQYRVKINHYGRQATLHEVLSSSVLQLLGCPDTPNLKFVTDNPPGMSPVAIASKVIPGFSDWGDFLIESGVNYVAGPTRERYQAALGDHDRARRQAVQLRRSDPALDQLLNTRRKSTFAELTPAEQASLVSYRRALRDALRAQDTMLSLLPAAFHQSLVRALYVGEIVGNWDFSNQARANTGFIIAPSGELKGAVSVDLGNSGLNGFKGRSKANSAAWAPIPASIDDPYLRMDDTLHPQAALAAGARLPQQALDFTQVSPSFGLVGFLPRSSVFAGVMREVIQQQNFDPHHAPDAACEVAFRLVQLPAHALRVHFNQEWQAGLAHPDPAVRTMFLSAGDPHTLSEQWAQRFDAIIHRAGKDAVTRWAEKHDATARQIRDEVDGAQPPAGRGGVTRV